MDQARSLSFALALVFMGAALPAAAAPPRAAATSPAAPAPASPVVPPPGAPAATTPGAVPAAAAPRRPRSYAACNRIAQQRRLRGAERRHFVSRCQLGYGRALFRRRAAEQH